MMDVMAAESPSDDSFLTDLIQFVLTLPADMIEKLTFRNAAGDLILDVHNDFSMKNMNSEQGRITQSFPLYADGGAANVVGTMDSYNSVNVQGKGRPIVVPSTYTKFFATYLGTDLHSLRSVLGARIGINVTAAQVQQIHNAMGTVNATDRNTEPCRRGRVCARDVYGPPRSEEPANEPANRQHHPTNPRQSPSIRASNATNSPPSKSYPERPPPFKRNAGTESNLKKNQHRRTTGVRGRTTSQQHHL